jgi:hypothetical protein
MNKAGMVTSERVHLHEIVVIIGIEVSPAEVVRSAPPRFFRIACRSLAAPI